MSSRIASVTIGALAAVQLVHALDNGLAVTPPMGWRSWNCYHGDVTDSKIRSTIDAITAKTRMVDGVAHSLADLGYQHVGIDDGWQACGTGAYAHIFPHLFIFSRFSSPV